MRDDLTESFSVEKNKKRNKPATLFIISWPAIGELDALTLYMADRSGITIDGIEYSPLIKDPGDIRGVLESSGRQLRAVIINSPSTAENLPIIFLSRPPELAEVTVVQWFVSDRMAAPDSEELLVGKIEDPVEINQSTSSLNIVNISSSYGRRVLGNVITLEAYPEAPEVSIGLVKPIVIGTVDEVPGIPVSEVPETVLRSVAAPDDTELIVASTEGFALAGTLMINDDEVTYTGKSDTTFTGCSGVEDYIYADEKIYQKISEYRYLVNDPDYKIKSISDVKIDGDLADTDNHSVDVDKGEVVFNTQPMGLSSIDTKFLQAQNTDTGSGNNATDPLKAIDVSPTSYAKISQLKPTLSLKHTPSLPDIGVVGKVFLRVEHFMEERLTSDVLEAYITGIGKIGSLSRPAVDDKVSSSGGSVNFTHAHLDTLGFPISDPRHLHNEDSAPTITQNALSGTGSRTIVLQNSQYYSITFPDPGPGTWATAEYGFDLEVTGGRIDLTVMTYITVHTVRGTSNKSLQLWSKRLDTGERYTLGGNMDSETNVLEIRHTAKYSIEFVLKSVTRVITMTTARTTSSESSNVRSSKSGSVTSFTGSQTINSETEKSTSTVVDHFDITDHVKGDWGWFTGKETQIKYIGTSNGRTAFISHVAFEIEFARRRTQIAQVITAKVQGVVDDANSLIESPVEIFKWSILAVGLDASLIDIVSMGKANDLMNSVYKIDGMIVDKVQVRDLWKEWGRSCRTRFYWERGHAKALYLVARVPLEAPAPVREITSKQIVQENKISTLTVARSRASDMANNIDLNYKKDFSTGEYAGTVSESNDDSIALHGRKEKENFFDFPWIRDETTAKEIARFYIGNLSEPYNIFSLKVYLDNMDIELEDIITFFPPMYNGRTVAAVVRQIDRALGIGESRKMDTLTITAMEIPYTYPEIKISVEPAEFAFETSIPTVHLSIVDLIISVEPAEFAFETSVPTVYLFGGRDLIISVEPAEFAFETSVPIVTLSEVEVFEPVAWFKAGAGVSPGDVETWENQSALPGPDQYNLRQDDAALRPRLNPTGLNGYPAIEFESGDKLLTPVPAGSPLDLATEFAIYVVLMLTTFEDSPSIISRNDNGGMRLRSQSKGFAQLSISGDGENHENMTTSQKLQLNVPFVLEVLYIPGIGPVFTRNGESLGLRSSKNNTFPSPFSNSADLIIGNSRSIGGPFAGFMSEIIILDKVPSTNERNRIIEGLAGSYDLPWTPVV